MGKRAFRLIFVVLLVAAPYSAWASCYQSSIQEPTPFMGNHGEVFQLIDGSFWEVTHEYEYLYEYYPEVVVCPSRGQIILGGKALSVQQVGGGSVGSGSSGNIIETNIDGEFEGWEGETIFRLMNGQIWQQSSYSYLYHYSYSPRVIIIQRNGGYEMQVEGVNQQIRVHQLR
ncbi:hypothetical protein [Vreelandella titanicae]|uniref:hypothetical protein n=1 Tax=Vreelandella titanicae TaxID=664683 RepID=UPI0016803B5F|nr:hypothetical protein [Halomonas titanicae]QNU63978.1 hypothetical protein HZS52_06420 [Halomonas titanicae]